MNLSAPLITLILLVCSKGLLLAQKPFSEGTITYQVTLTSPDQKVFQGSYVFYYKGAELKKELRMDNGYVDITIINYEAGTIYNLQERDDAYFAIQLSMKDMEAKQTKFKGGKLGKIQATGKQVSGIDVYTATVTYNDGSSNNISLTKEWMPPQAGTYNRFPDASYLPLWFSYKEDNGISMVFDAQRVETKPVPSSIFRIPRKYRMISYEEYNRLKQQ